MGLRAFQSTPDLLEGPALSWERPATDRGARSGRPAESRAFSGNTAVAGAGSSRRNGCPGAPARGYAGVARGGGIRSWRRLSGRRQVLGVRDRAVFLTGFTGSSRPVVMS